jgi:hypothetical protein
VIQVLATPVLAGENSISYCSYLDEKSTDWSRNHVLPQFNESLGVLTKVELNSTLNGYQTFGYENEDGLYGYDISVIKTIAAITDMPFGLPLLIELIDSIDYCVTCYDCITDYGGTSGFNNSYNETDHTARTYTSRDELAFFIGEASRNYSTRAYSQYSVQGSEVYSDSTFQLLVL